MGTDDFGLETTVNKYASFHALVHRRAVALVTYTPILRIRLMLSAEVIRYPDTPPPGKRGMGTALTVTEFSPSARASS